jgi:four helix bundle protein
MNVAEASSEECRYYLILTEDLGYGDTTQLSANLDEVSRMLRAHAAAILSPNS